ncbi:MAG: hypothetical protein ACI4VN_05095 [Clostridia bacterium]|nr:hypothetical protein [Clostridia bacterium]
MVIAIFAFLGCYYILANLFGALFLAAEGFISLMVLGCLAFGALALFGGSRSRWAWMPCFLCLLGSVAIEVLAPYEAMIEILGAIALAVVITVLIKRPMLQYVRRDAARTGGPRLRTWQQVLIRIL